MKALIYTPDNNKLNIAKLMTSVKEVDGLLVGEFDGNSHLAHVDDVVIYETETHLMRVICEEWQGIEQVNYFNVKKAAIALFFAKIAGINCFKIQTVKLYFSINRFVVLTGAEASAFITDLTIGDFTKKDIIRLLTSLSHEGPIEVEIEDEDGNFAYINQTDILLEAAS